MLEASGVGVGEQTHSSALPVLSVSPGSPLLLQNEDTGEEDLDGLYRLIAGPGRRLSQTCSAAHHASKQLLLRRR